MQGEEEHGRCNREVGFEKVWHMEWVCETHEVEGVTLGMCVCVCVCVCVCGVEGVIYGVRCNVYSDGVRREALEVPT